MRALLLFTIFWPSICAIAVWIVLTLASRSSEDLKKARDHFNLFFAAIAAWVLNLIKGAKK